MTDIPKPGQVADGPLAEIEAAHGFVFGNPDSDTGHAAPVAAALVCSAPRCERKGQFVQIHADTLLPVHCGGCGTVLHCNHDTQTTVHRAGTIGAPVEHTITACRLCRTEFARQTRDLDPAEMLRSLPVGVLDQQL